MLRLTGWTSNIRDDSSCDWCLWWSIMQKCSRCTSNNWKDAKGCILWRFQTKRILLFAGVPVRKIHKQAAPFICSHQRETWNTLVDLHKSFCHASMPRLWTWWRFPSPLPERPKRKETKKLDMFRQICHKGKLRQFQLLPGPGAGKAHGYRQDESRAWRLEPSNIGGNQELQDELQDFYELFVTSLQRWGFNTVVAGCERRWRIRFRIPGPCFDVWIGQVSNHGCFKPALQRLAQGDGRNRSETHRSKEGKHVISIKKVNRCK